MYRQNLICILVSHLHTRTLTFAFADPTATDLCRVSTSVYAWYECTIGAFKEQANILLNSCNPKCHWLCTKAENDIIFNPILHTMPERNTTYPPAS